MRRTPFSTSPLAPTACAASPLFALLLALVVLLAPRAAFAWCRTTTAGAYSPTREKPCDTRGKPLFWRSRCIGFAEQRDASKYASLETFRAIARKAFGAWSAVDCPSNLATCEGDGGGRPTMDLRDHGPVTCDRVQFDDGGKNANVIMFRDRRWPYPQSAVTIALTTVTFDPDSGEIVDADMEINSATHKITTTDEDGEIGYDLQSILTHEAGHFLGLAHTQPENPNATMFVRYEPGSTRIRTLTSDDRCAVCNVYPPKRSAKCDDRPVGGLADACGSPEQAPIHGVIGCRLGAGAFGDRGARPFLIGGAGVAVVIGVARRRRRSRGGSPACPARKTDVPGGPAGSGKSWRGPAS